MSQKKSNTALSGKQRKAIPMLLAGLNDSEVALRCGISRRTVSRWKKQRSFTDGMNDIAKGCYRDSMARLSSLSTQAVTVLADVMRDTVMATATERLREARTVLEMSTAYNCQGGAGMVNLIRVAKFVEGDILSDSDFDIERESA